MLNPCEEVHRSPKRIGSVDYEALPIQDINAILERLVFTPTTESTLKWLQAEMTDEIKVSDFKAIPQII